MEIKINQIELRNNSLKNVKLDKINIININYNFTKFFEPISSRSNKYISECFNKAFNIIKKNKVSGFINGPISKKFFLKKKFLGITEFIASKFKIQNNYAMLIFNKDLSVCPITTHLPLEKVSNKITKKDIITKSLIIDKFYKINFSLKPKIAITGLNPHCENFFNESEEKRIIEPAIKILKKKGIKILGPYPADTIFLSQNLKKFNVIIGMYHDQVLTPIKTLYGFNAINITLGLPFLRISPDHGPNNKMIGKNESDPQSLIYAIKFLNRK
jgi:4-hydroxythreonine-4-phosphate dehydrogenase